MTTQNRYLLTVLLAILGLVAIIIFSTLTMKKPLRFTNDASSHAILK